MNSPVSPLGPREPRPMRTQSSREIAHINAAPEDSEVVIVTQNGLRAVPKNRFQASVINWDVSLSEILSSPIVKQDNDQSPLALDGNAFHHYGVVNAGQQTTNAFVEGLLPKQGKHWLLLCGAVDEGGSISYQFKDHLNDVFLEVIFQQRTVAFQSKFYGGVHERIHAVINSRAFILVCIDIDSSKVDFYDNKKKLISMEFTEKFFERAFLALVSTTHRNLNNYGKVSTLATDTPCDIPEDFEPLKMSVCRIATPFTHQYLRPIAYTRIGSAIVSPNKIYLSDGQNFFALSDADTTASRLEVNHFAEEQFFSKDVHFKGGYTLKTSEQGSMFFGNNPNANSLILDRPESGWVLAFGDNVWADLHYGKVTLLIGQELGNQLQYSDYSTIVGTGWDNLNIVTGLTTLGHGNGRRVSMANRTVVIGNNSVTGSLETTEDLIVVGDDSFQPQGTEHDAFDTTVIGTCSLNGSIVGPSNVVVGNRALTASKTDLKVTANVVMGAEALSEHIGDVDSTVAVGKEAGKGVGNLSNAVLVGEQSGRETIGNGLVAVGANALDNKDGFDLPNIDATAIGYKAMQGQSGIRNSTALGANARVYGDDQVWLGDTHTVTYTHVPSAVRADSRDMSFVQRTSLGLDFVMRLRPVQYRTNFRDRYRNTETRPIPPEALRVRPTPPQLAPQDPAYQNELLAYREDERQWQVEHAAYQTAQAEWVESVRRWESDNSLASIQNDPEQADDQVYQGIVGQELEALAGEMGIEFAGLKKLTSQTGDSVMCVSYDEFVPPLINAVQELTKEVRSDEFVTRVAAKVLEMIRASR